MASLTWDRGKTGKSARIQFVIGDCRQAVRLGRVPVKVAQTWLYRIEQLVSCRVGGVAHDADLAGWLRDLPDDAHERLARVGLVSGRQAAAVVTLGTLCDAFKTRAVVKASTAKNFPQTLDSLTSFYGAEKPLAAITPASADEWRAWVASDTKGESGRKKKRLSDDNRLAPATVAKRVRVAKQVFAKAVRWGWITSNPFAALKAGPQANAARAHYIDAETTVAILDACPSVSWRLVVGLCRFAGLRCPSEVGRLTWADVDWDRGRLTVRAPKTEHHGADHAVRVVPMIPQLRVILADAFDRAEPGETLVVPMAAEQGANLRTPMDRIVTRAGCRPWPRTFQNLRSSFATDVVQQFPAHVAGAWLGHSPTVAAAHYWQARDCNFDVAVTRGLDAHCAGGALQGAKAAQIPAQQAAATGCITSHGEKAGIVIPAENAVSPRNPAVVNTGSVGPV
jgi:integrase